MMHTYKLTYLLKSVIHEIASASIHNKMFSLKYACPEQWKRILGKVHLHISTWNCVHIYK